MKYWFVVGLEEDGTELARETVPEDMVDRTVELFKSFSSWVEVIDPEGKIAPRTAWPKGEKNMNMPLRDIRKALDEVSSAAIAELVRLGSPHASILEECFANIDRAVGQLEVGEAQRSLFGDAQRLAAQASERVMRIRKPTR